MARIERLTIQGFRSFGSTPAVIEFGAQMAVIWGANSEGKTSLAEAFEFLLTGDIARRALLSSAIDEFENALRNVHLPPDKDTHVEAVISGSDGMTHTLRRTLIEDFSKRRTCETKLELDGAETSASELAQIGIELSEPPLSAPVLMQHTLGYLFSANPKERANYFKSILEVNDVEDVREALRSIGNGIPEPARTNRDKVSRCQSALSSCQELLLSLTMGTPTQSAIRSVLGTVAKKVLTDAGEMPPATLDEQIVRIDGMTTKKQADTFPLHGFARRVRTVEWHAPAEGLWESIDGYKSALRETDKQFQETAAFFEKLLKLPVVAESTGDIDCPVCEAPAGLTQNRIEAIRKQVRDTETFRTAARNARTNLGSLSTSLSNLEQGARTGCPDFLSWDRPRRVSEGFRTDRIAPLLDESTRLFLRPWFEAAGQLMRARHRVLGLVAKVKSILAEYQSDIDKLTDDAELRLAFDRLRAAHRQLAGTIRAYEQAIAPLEKPLKDSVAEKSDTTGWATLIDLARDVPGLAAELLDAAAHKKLSAELDQACKQVESAKEAVLEDKFDDLATEVRTWWNRLRPEEAAFFSDLGLRKRTQRTIDFKAGLAPASDRENAKLRNAVAVFSQSQLHCLGLATFFARAAAGGGFLLLDDPILAIDDNHSVHFFTAVLRELERRNVQVIILTYDQKTWKEIQTRYDDGRCEAFQLHLDSPTEGTQVLKSSDTLTAMLRACQPFTTSSLLEHRKDGCQRIRDIAERWCKELLVQERRKQCEESAMISDYDGSQGTLGHLIPLVTPYLDSDERGKLRSIMNNTNPGNHDDDVPSKESLKVYLGDLKALKAKYLA